MSANRAAANDESPRTPDLSRTGGCVNCSRPVNFDNFVQCDQCDSWWHMICAGVTESIATKPWTCRNCLPASVCSKSSNKSARIALRLKQLEEERAIQQRALEAEKKAIENSAAAEKRAIEQEKKLIQEKYTLLEEQLEEERDDVSHRSRVSRRTSEQLVTRWVEQQTSAVATGEEAAGGVPSTTMPRPLIDSKVTPTGNSATEHSQHSALNSNRDQPIQREQTSADRSKHQGNQQRNTGAIPKTVPKQRVEDHPMKPVGNPIPSAPPVMPPGKPPLFSVPTEENPTRPSNYYQDLIDKLGPISPVRNDFNPAPFKGTQPAFQGLPTSTVPLPTPLGRNENENIPQTNQCPNTNGNQQNMPPTYPAPRVPEFGPSPSQLAARQIMPRDLPPFAGNPADWPIFISAFVNTTAACGYSSVENLTRLQRCLKGPAYEAVRSRLMLPESVPQVINTLQLLYGRPELLINVLLDKVRSTPAPKAERLETLIEFGMAVQCLCDHLEAAGLQSHLTNPCLLMELVEKLPAHVKMEWANFMQRYPEVNL